MYNKGINRFSRIIMFTGLLCVFYSCEQESDGNGLSNNQLQGRVTLENQTNHEGIVVYVSGINVGTMTSQDGEFIITLDDSIDVNGVFPIYFYYAWYRIDSIQITIEGNSILREQADVNEDGEGPNRQLTQIVAFDMRFDQETYSHGDTLRIWTDIINRSGSNITLGLNYIYSSEYPPIFVYTILSAETDSLERWNLWPGDIAPFEILIEEGDTINAVGIVMICTYSDSLPPCSNVPIGDYFEPGRYYWVPAIREMKLNKDGFYVLFDEVAVFPDLDYYLYLNQKFIIEGIYTTERLDTFFPKVGIPTFEIQ